MKLTIKNLAKISKAEVELNGITVVAGYNSTGKSTISKALLGVMSAYSNLNEDIIAQRSFEIRRVLDSTVSGMISAPTYFRRKTKMRRLARELSADRSLKVEKESLCLAAEEGLEEEEKEGGTVHPGTL